MSSASPSDPALILDAAGTVHASCVAVGPAAVLILGGPGSGKSTLALELLATGARLVADDRVHLQARDGGVLASAPENIRGMIEANGIGLLAAESVPQATVRLVVDLNQDETDRLPPRRHVNVIGCETELIYNTAKPGFAAAIRQYLIGGRLE